MREPLASSLLADTDVIVKARLDRVDMQMLDKLVEGLGHLGIVTTTNKALGEVMILSTKDCWPDLKKAIERMPFGIVWESESARWTNCENIKGRIKGEEPMNVPEIQNQPQADNKYADADLIIKARVDRSEIQILCKLVEGLGHLGIVTTTNKELGDVNIQTTKDCWADLKKAIEEMPLKIEII